MMGVLLNAESLRPARGVAAESERFDLTLTGNQSAEDIFDAVAALGMARAGVSAVRVDRADCVLLVVSAYFHGAFRLSKAAIRELLAGDKKDIFAVRDALCDYGAGALLIECEADIDAEVQRGLVLARCEGYARMLGMLPGNLLRARQMADYLRAMAEDCGLICRELNDDALREMGCGGILAVNQGTNAQAALVTLQYAPVESDGRAPIALVGKGVMFDSGGYHLKNIDEMRGMQGDMCGAATAAEALEAFARLNGRRPARAVLPLVENLIGPEAVRMGDVILTLGSKTVEVYNTDAEGRLILCDGLTLAQRNGAKTVIDIATLTYGAQKALGDEIGAFFSNDDGLAEALSDNAQKWGEPLWRMPLDERYHRALKWSACAELANYAPGYGASACTAAAFLEEFIEPGTRWGHIDIVGPAQQRGASKRECPGATGFGMKPLVEMLERGA